MVSEGAAINVKPSKPKAKTKKIQADKDAGSSGHHSEAKGSETSNTSVCASPKVPSPAWFTSEIQSMMFGFGDCSTPLQESARLVEEIVRQQMNSVLMQSAEIALCRGARFIGLEDIVFLLRKDKVKLARLMKYLEVKDLKASVKLAFNEEEDTGEAGASETKAQPPRYKRTRLCYDFMSSIDQTGELLSVFDEDIFDEVKHERDMRAERQTQCMNQAQYLEYSEARRSSFCRKYRITKFRDWLLADNLTEIKPNTIALEMFNYLAYETVAQIVDLALLVKQDTKGNPADPMARLMPPVVCNPDFPSIQVTSQMIRSTTLTRSESPAQGSTSPSQSPSRSQTPEKAPSSSVSHASPGQSSSAAPQPKPKPKKRRKSEGKVALELSSVDCILPSDIQEAIRRYWQPYGPFTLFSKVHNAQLGKRLLSC